MAPQKPQAFQFGAPRPAGDGDFNVHVRTSQDVRDQHFRPSPPPHDCSQPPYELSFSELLPGDKIAAI